ncbi:MAG: hypothetical protein WD403_11250 [Pirellulales bacterium]
MAGLSLEQRIAILESQVDKLRDEVRAAQQRNKDWRQTIGAFTDDEGMQQILKDAMRLREIDRRKTKPKATAKRKTRR